MENSKTNEKERKNWIDWMKTLGMLAIIWGHCFPTNFSPFLYSFSVCAFFVISGYLVRKESSQRVFWSKLFHTLLIPYLFFSVLKAIQTVFSSDGLISLFAITTGFHSIGDVTGCGKLWFIYTLIILKIIFQYYASTASRRIILLVLSFAGAITYSYYTDELTWAVGNALISMPFFLLGFQLKHSCCFSKMESKFLSIARWKTSIMVFMSALLTYVVSYFNDEAWMYKGEYGNSIVLFSIAGLSGVFFLFTLSCLLNKVRYKGCQVISVGSIAILAYHQDINHPMLEWVRMQEWSALLSDMATLLVSTITLLVFIPIIYIISRYLPFAIGYRVVK